MSDLQLARSIGPGHWAPFKLEIKFERLYRTRTHFSLMKIRPREGLGAAPLPERNGARLAPGGASTPRFHRVAARVRGGRPLFTFRPRTRLPVGRSRRPTFARARRRKKSRACFHHLPASLSSSDSPRSNTARFSRKAFAIICPFKTLGNPPPFALKP